MTATVAPLLTTTQRRILDVVRAFAVANGRPPTMPEISASTGLSVDGCWAEGRHLLKLGWIRVRSARSLKVLNPVDGTDS